MTTPKRKSNQNSQENQLRVVGIGASAGGLEALQQFFKYMPINIDLAYVVVQHLSPDYKSMMDELLSRYTTMPISVIEDGMKLEANHIFLIPPRQNLEIFSGKLFLTKQLSGKGLNLPIDVFFRSLAEEKGKNAIAVILSGTGSDGTLGIKAIKEADGLVMVQDENTAKFFGMPHSALATGLVDYILPPEEMGPELENFLKHPLVNKKQKISSIPDEGVNSLTKVILIIKNYVGIDFSYYKENTILRRLERRVSINRFNNLEEYLPFLMENDKEKEILYREFLIGVTQFFRDKEAFDSIQNKVLPELFKDNKKHIRVWTTGCSTGEEAYSIAIMLFEAAEKYNFKGDLKLFASDIDRKSIDVASRGFYPESIVADVDAKLLAKYFVKTDNGYQIEKEIRNIIVFTAHNVLKDPPFSKLDMVVCRNLFIYLKPDIQASLLHRFYYSLNNDGFLFMGSSETLGGMSTAFDVVDLKNKIYRYKAGFTLPIIDSLVLDHKKGINLVPEMLSSQAQKRKTKSDDLLRNVLSEIIPPSILVDSNYFIVSIFNNINPFTEFQSGNYSNELFSILPKELGLFVNNLLRQLKNEKLIVRNIGGLKSFEGQQIKVTGRKLDKDDFPYYLLTFEFVTDVIVQKNESPDEGIVYSSELNARVVDLEKELSSAKENLAATIEELESANEELQSSNEELIASNEELQSTNEELQSVNEELYTVNTEHQQKIEELTVLNNDVNNLLKNTEVAAIYLDSKLCIRKITPQARLLTNVLESDIGRPVSHLSVMEGYPTLADDVNMVMTNLIPIDREILDKENKTFFSRIRPYRTNQNAVEGVMLTFVDISELINQRRRAEVNAERLIQSLSLGKMAWWDWDITTGHVNYNERKATMLGYSADEFPNDVYEICSYIHPDDYDITMQEMTEVLKGTKAMWDVKYRIRRKDGTYAMYHDQGSIKVRDEAGKPLQMIGMVIDVSDSYNTAINPGMNVEILHLVFKNNPLAHLLVDGHGNITYANDKVLDIFKMTRSQLFERNCFSPVWGFSSTDGRLLLVDELPLSIIKRTNKPLYEFKCMVNLTSNQKILIQLEGAPIDTSQRSFNGAIFTIKPIEHEKA